VHFFVKIVGKFCLVSVITKTRFSATDASCGSNSNYDYVQIRHPRKRKISVKMNCKNKLIQNKIAVTAQWKNCASLIQLNKLTISYGRENRIVVVTARRVCKTIGR